MKMAVITFPGHTFEQMFARWSPFFAEGTCESTYYMLRQGLKERGIELVSIESLLAGEQCEAVLHCEPYRWDILRRFPQLVHVYLDSEPAIVIPMHADFGLKLLVRLVFDAVITANHRVRGRRVYNVTYPRDFPRLPKPEQEVPWEQKKLACMFAANKFAIGKTELYSARRAIIKCFEKNAPESFDLYGSGWPTELSVYRGYAADKFSTSQKYRFSISLSNVAHVKGLIDEKIYDAMLAGTVPVYQGIDEIEEYAPAGCFIDYRKFSGPLECLRYLQNMTQQEYEQYRRNIKDFLSDPKTHERFSARDIADKLVLASHENPVKKKRHIWVLQAFQIINKVYDRICNWQKKNERWT